MPRAHDAFDSLAAAPRDASPLADPALGRHGPPLVASAGLTIAEAFVRQATATPHAIALVTDDRTLTYGELLARGRGLAAQLVAQGVGPDVLVGVDAQRDISTIVGLVGIILAGGAYLPLDRDLPPARLSDMLRQTQAPCVLAPAAQRAHWAAYDLPVIDVDASTNDSPPGRPREVHAARLRPSHLAYCTWSSGSTGLPKGILTTQGGVVRLVLEARYVRLGPGESLWHAAPLSFDASTFEIWGALLTGARLVLAPTDATSFADTAARVRRHGVTTMWLTAALFHRWCDGPIAELRGLRQLLAGGDVLRPDAVCTALARLPGCRIVNGYGPTEATTFAACHEVPPDFSGGPVPIGRPIQGTTLRLLDEALRDVADGEPGEICIGGPGLARGYLGDAEATAARFVNAPGGPAGTRLYRSGDLGRWRLDGELEFLGRIDRQVKIRGIRVEPGEVERALVAHAGVRDAVVVAQAEGARLERRLVAHVVAAGDPPGVEVLRAHLRARLPEALVPTLWNFLDELPLKASGKIDMEGLPVVRADRLLAGVPYRAPRTTLEARVAQAWARALGVGQVGLDDRFLALGGNSLQALAVAHALSDTAPGLRIPPPLGSLTLEGHAAAVDQALASSCDAGEPPPAIDPADTRASYTQEQLWFLEQQADEAWRAYRFQARIDFEGALDVPALASALDALVGRHAILRTTFVSEGGVLVQRVASTRRAQWRVDDLSGLDEKARAAALAMLVAQEREHRFDIAAAPPVRWRLAILAPHHHVLLQTEHHLVHDGQSFRIVLRDLGALYAQAVGRASTALPALEATFLDHCRAERRWLASRAFERERAAWTERLADLDEAPPLFRDQASVERPDVARRGGQWRHAIAAPRIARIDAAASVLGVSRFAWMFAAWSALCGRLARRRRFLVGTALANRPGSAWTQTVGPFVNMVPVATRPELHLGFDAFVREVAGAIAFALTHGTVPLGEIVHGLGLSQRLRGGLPFNVGFSFHDALPLDAEFPGLACRVQEALPNGGAKFDLDVVVIHGQPALQGGVEMLWEFDASLFDAATIARLAAGFDALVDAVAATPTLEIGQLPVMGDDERERVLRFAQPQEAADAASAPDVSTLVAALAASDPSAPALAWGRRTMTRGALHEHVSALAARLAQEGVAAGSVVAVLLPRGFGTVVAALAVLEAGGVYLPLDGRAPSARLAELMADSGAALLLTHAELQGRRPSGAFDVLELDDPLPAVDDAPAARPSTARRALAPMRAMDAGPRAAESRLGERRVARDDERIAYAIYTSGSMGSPKAVRVGRRALAIHARACRLAYGLVAQDRVLFCADASVDASLEQMLAPLAAGACVVVAEPGAWTLHELVRVVQTHAITVADLPTALWHAFVVEDEAALRALPLRLLLIGGEPALRARRPARALPYRVLNAYGPTEATITACVGEIGEERDDATGPHEPIGRPLAGGRAYVLDAALAPLPRGIAGELCLAGPRLAHDYFGRPELTRDAFVADPFGPPGSRLHRTGDLARWLPDGRLEFLGRLDGQLKVRGFRVEIGEVEAALARCAGVREAVVYAEDDGAGSQRLVAAVVALAGAALRPADLARTLAERLPEPMIPTTWQVLAQLPRTPGGKVDRRALATAHAAARAQASRRANPDHAAIDGALDAAHDPDLRGLLAIVGELLPDARATANDDLVALGLHSVLILRFIAQCRQRLDATLKVRDVYQLATPSAIAAHIRANR